MEPTDEQREQFLEHVREGLNRQQAAEKVGSTGTKFKFLCKRDVAFNRSYEDALVEGRGELIQRLERCAVELAQNGSWPALKFLLTAYSPEFAWARSAKVEVSGEVEIHAIAATLTRYLPSAQVEELINAVEQRMLEEGGEQQAA